MAEAVVSAALEVAEKEKLTNIRELIIRIGELQQIDRSIFLFALEEHKSDKLKNAKFKLIIAKTSLRCRVCNKTWLFEKNNLDPDIIEAIHFVPEVAHIYISCPNCSSPDFEILEGRGVWLENLKGEQ